MRPRLLLALAGALAALAALPAASSAQDRVNVRVGIADQGLTWFDDPKLQDLDIRQTRYFIHWNVMDNREQRLKARAWVKRARAAGMRPLIHVSTDDLREKEGERPSVREYRRNVNRIIAYFRKLGVRDFGAWNEANHKTQPTWDSPNHAALYFREMYRSLYSKNRGRTTACSTRSCRIVALDVLDQRGVERYIERFYDRLSNTYDRRARFVGIHNYSDVNRFRNRGTSSIIKTVRGETPNPRFWLTETGALVGFGTGVFECDPNSGQSIRDNEERAGKAMEWLFKQARTYRRYIDRVYVYNWVGTNCTNRFDVGVTRLDGSARPSYDVFARNVKERFKR